MAGFQFTPAGILPLGAPTPNFGDEVSPSNVAVQAPEIAREVPPAGAPVATAPRAKGASAEPAAFDPGQPLTGKDLAKAARARIRVLDQMLRAVPALQEERASLKRLLAAAAPRKTKPGEGKLQ